MNEAYAVIYATIFCVVPMIIAGAAYYGWKDWKAGIKLW